MRVWISLLSAIAAVSLASGASALQQPNGLTVPSAMGCGSGKPTGLLAAMACACTQANVCNIGAACPGGASSCDPGTNGTCETTLWHAPNDNSCIPTNHSGLDPAAEAQTTPETFHPTCALTFTVVSRGTAKFQDIFGWYNVTGSAPQASDLHPMLHCGDAAGKSVVLDLSQEPGYKGGEVGFFLITPEAHDNTKSCAGSDCCPTIARLGQGVGYAYYSQKAFNPDTTPSPYIHLLVLPSHLATTKFYFAWEDTFDTTSADFTDLVASVEGVECAGGGVSCDTGKKGTCAYGVTQCTKGVVSCTQVLKGSSETCNGVDEDCDGVADNGAVCPKQGDVCVNGECVHKCGSVEFPCAGSLACDQATGMCVEAACVGVACAVGQTCRGGACAAACDGVVCPRGQACAGDECIDLCKGVSCAPGQVCKDGVCFAGCNACDGIACASPLSCETSSGTCVDPSCATPCAAGTVCSSGVCVDACAGVACPRGETCAAGQCSGSGVADAGGGGGSLSPTGDGPSGSGGNVDGGANGDDGWGKGSPSGCGCITAGATDTGDARMIAFAIAGVALLARCRRRRCMQRANAR